MAHLICNYEILTKALIPNDLIPVITSILGRIESFGDVYNVIQARNYIRIIRANQNVHFAIWTKNYMVWKKAFDIEGKPDNCTFVISSSQLNKPAWIPDCVKVYADYIFTVYSLAYVKAHNIHIHCGFSHCLKCGHCYHRGNAMYVNEILKEDAKAYAEWKNAA